MKCPLCEKTMVAIRTDESNNPENGDTYTRTIYQCAEDDAWVTTELPNKK